MSRYTVLVFYLLFVQCSNVPENINNQVAQLEIESAIDVKRKECGKKMTPPQDKSPYPYPRLLVIQPKNSLRNIRLCSAAILRSECPLIDYPFICWFIYVPSSVGKFNPLFDFNKFNENNRFKPKL